METTYWIVKIALAVTGFVIGTIFNYLSYKRNN